MTESATTPSKHTYETVAGTEPQTYGVHVPRTIVHHQDADVFMMSEIGDGVFVQWGDCRKCKTRVYLCKCPDGPLEPHFMQPWRDSRFEKSLNTRPDPDYALLPNVIKWVKERGHVVLEPGALDELAEAAQEAQDAALGNSNDSEISLLRDALEMALGFLGLELPEPREEGYTCDGCGRDELTCSEDPCEDVILDRGEAACGNCGDALTREGDELVGSDGEVTCPMSDRPHGPVVEDTSTDEQGIVDIDLPPVPDVDDERDHAETEPGRPGHDTSWAEKHHDEAPVAPEYVDPAERLRRRLEEGGLDAGF